MSSAGIFFQESSTGQELKCLGGKHSVDSYFGKAGGCSQFWGACVHALADGSVVTASVWISKTSFIMGKGMSMKRP